MITAMQRMLDDLLAKRNVYENAKMYQCVATLETSIEIANHLLEKEKEQILNFYMWMRMNESAEQYFHYSDEDMFTEYLNQKQ